MNVDDFYNDYGTLERSDTGLASTSILFPQNAMIFFYV